MKITIWGNGLSAWTAAAALAQNGNQIIIVPTIGNVQSSEFKASNEPGLQQLIEEESQQNRLTQGTEEAGLANSIHFFALNPDQLPMAITLTAELSKRHPSQLLIINQSHFGIGSSDKLQQQLDEHADQCVAYLPDMLAEGSALKDFTKPENLIIGTTHDWALLNLRAIMRPFSKHLKQWLIMTGREAEFTKFANTGMLALRLGYINELANLAEKLGVDIETIRNAMITDPRIGPHYLNPGCGFGGQHFQQYIEALADLLEEARRSRLLETVLEENEKQKEQPFRKLWRHYNCNLQGLTITLWGLSFKPGTASIENAPSLKIIETLLAQDCTLQLHDPEANANIRQHFGERPQVKYFDNNYDALRNSDALLLLTEWNEYSSPDYDQVLSLMRQPLIIDGRNIFDKELLKQLGFTYYGTGR